MSEPHSSNFRVITTNFLGVRIFRQITVNTELQDKSVNSVAVKLICIKITKHHLISTLKFIITKHYLISTVIEILERVEVDIQQL